MGWDICQCIQLLGSWNESGCFIQHGMGTANWFLHPTLCFACCCRPPACQPILLTIHSPSVLWTCPNYLALPPKYLTRAVLLRYSLPLLSWSQKEPQHLIFATSIFCRLSFFQRRCLWVVPDRSLSPVFCKALLASCWDCYRDITPVVFLHPLQPARTCPPLRWNVDPQHFKSSTLFHLRAVLLHQSTWVWTKPNFEIKMSNLTHIRPYGANKCDSSAVNSGCQVAGTGERGGVVEDNGRMLPRAGRSGAFAATGY